MEFRFLDREWSWTTAAASSHRYCVAAVVAVIFAWCQYYCKQRKTILSSRMGFCVVAFSSVCISKELNARNIIHFIYDAKYWSISLAVVRFSSNISFSTPPPLLLLLPPPEQETVSHLCVCLCSHCFDRDSENSRHERQRRGEGEWKKVARMW